MTKESNSSKDTDILKTKEVEESSLDSNIDYDLVCSGPLYVDPRHIKPGYVPAFVSDKPGEIEMYKRFGYEVVVDDFRVGDQTASSSSRFGSAVTVQSKCGQLLVLMVIKEELHKKLSDYRESKNRERTASLGSIEGVPKEYQTFNGQPIGEYKITKRS